MKKLQLIVGQIISMFREQKNIFAIFFLSSIVCTITFLYCYGNLVGYIGIRDSEARYYREYKVYIDDEVDTKQLVEQLQQFQGEYIEEILISHYAYAGEAIYASLNESSRWKWRSGRIHFTEEELKSGANVMIVPWGYPLDKKTFQIGEHEYEVIGSHRTSNIEYRVTLQNYLNNGYEPGFISFMAEKVPTPKMHETIMQTLQETFPNWRIETLYIIINSYIENLPGQIARIIILYAISVITFMALMKFMMERAYQDLVVFHMVGASQKSILQLAIAEIVVLSITTTGIAILIHSSLYEPVFQFFNMNENVYYSWMDYLFLFVVNVLVVQMIHLPFIISMGRNSIMELHKKYTSI